MVSKRVSKKLDFKNLLRVVTKHRFYILGMLLPGALFGMFYAIGLQFKGTTTHDKVDYRDMLPKEQLVGLEKRDDGPCAGGFEVKLPQHSKSKGLEPMCTGGPDILEDAQSDGPFVVTTDKNVECFGDNVSGKRVQAIYAVASDKPDRYDEMLPYFKQWANSLSGVMNQSAAKTGGVAKIKWVTEGDCTINVRKVILSPTGDDSFDNTVAEVRDAGYHDTVKKYLMWTDASLYCGLGTIQYDDRPDPQLNKNNTYNFYPSYSRVDSPCWGRYRSTELHEIMHNLGAVQRTSPNSRGGHCTDDFDLMCTSFIEVCPFDQEPLLDCNNDDYFSSNPEDGSYLATHWNTFNSDYVYSVKPEDTEPPAKPDNLVLEETNEGIKLVWDESIDEQGSVSYLVYRERYKLDTFENIDSSPVPEFIDRYTQANTEYRYYVVAVDESGNRSEPSRSEYIKTTGEASTDNTDTTPPQAANNLKADNIITNGFTLSWSIPEPADVYKISIFINNGLNSSFYNDNTLHSICCSLSSNAQYSVFVRVYDSYFNYADSSTIVVKTASENVPPSTSVPLPYNLLHVSTNGSRVTITAKIDSIDNSSGSLNFDLYRVEGNTSYSQVGYSFSSTTTSKTYTFIDTMAYPQNINGYFILVQKDNVELGRSSTLNYSYSGSPESNPPPTPTNLQLLTSSSPPSFRFDEVTDDSGLAHHYEVVITGPGFNFVKANASTSTLIYGLNTGVSYTATAKAVDIWGNKSVDATINFTGP